MMEELTKYEQKVAELLEERLAAAGIDPADDDLTFEQIAQIEEITKSVQDDVRELEFD